MTDNTIPRTQYLTVSEVAEELRVTRMTVYRMIHTGALRALLVSSRTYRIPADAYADYKAQLDSDAVARQQRTTSAPHIPGQLSIPAATDGLSAL